MGDEPIMEEKNFPGDLGIPALVRVHQSRRPQPVKKEHQPHEGQTHQERPFAFTGHSSFIVRITQLVNAFHPPTGMWLLRRISKLSPKKAVFPSVHACLSRHLRREYLLGKKAIVAQASGLCCTGWKPQWLTKTLHINIIFPGCRDDGHIKKAGPPKGPALACWWGGFAPY